MTTENETVVDFRLAIREVSELLYRIAITKEVLSHADCSAIIKINQAAALLREARDKWEEEARG